MKLGGDWFCFGEITMLRAITTLRKKWRTRFSRSRRTALQAIALFSFGLWLIVACSPEPQSSDSAPAESAAGGRVSVGTTLQARTLDPADAYEIFPGILLYNLGDRLYTYEPGTTDLVPQLATEMPEISEDGLTYTIPLREDVMLHDGTPFNAEVMAFSIERFMENGGRPAFLLADKIAAVEATGDYELTMTLQESFAAFTALLTFWGVTPVPPDTYEIAAGSFQPDTFIGSGPYKLASFSPDAIKLDVNQDYWGEAPSNEGVDIQIFTSAANLYNTFRTGSVDVAYQTLDPDQIASLEREADSNDWTVIEAGTTVTNFLTLNQKIEPFDDVRVRQAVAAMIDRELINQRVFQGQAEPLYSLIPTSFDIYEPVFEEAYGDGNFDQARELLTAAGFSESNPFTLELWYPSSSTTRSIVATTLKESIEQGLPGLVNVEINSAESATLWENVEKGVYPTVLANWYPDYYDADTFIQPFMSCGEGSEAELCVKGESQDSGSFYFSDRANTLLSQQRSESDSQARQQIFKELQTLLQEDVPYVPLWQNKDYVFAQANVDGVEIQPTQQFLFWQIDK